MIQITRRLSFVFLGVLALSSPLLIYALGNQTVITTVAGTGVSGFNGDDQLASTAQLAHPIDVAFDNAGNMYIADSSNTRIRKLILSTGIITTVAGTGICCFNGDNQPATNAWMTQPFGLALDKTGNLYIADAGGHRVRKVISSTGIITTAVGTGVGGFNGDNQPATNAQLNSPAGVALDKAGNLYIADWINHRVRKVISPTGIITTVAGTGVGGFNGDNQPATNAWLNRPSSVALDEEGNLYIADQVNHRVRKVISSTGIIITVAGTGVGGFNGDNQFATVAQLNFPFRVALDKAGNLYIADDQNHRVRKVISSTGIITTVAGTGVSGFNGDDQSGATAQLSQPAGVTLDEAGNLYIADSGNDRVRKVSDSQSNAGNDRVYLPILLK